MRYFEFRKTYLRIERSQDTLKRYYWFLLEKY